MQTDQGVVVKKYGGWMTGAVLILLVALPALAGEQDGTELHPADRALIHGYDPASMQLLWAAILDRESEDVCSIDESAAGDGGYVYDIDDQGEVTVTGADGDCTFHATDVTGPNGQVNHGTVVSAFVKALKESDYEGNRGCMIKLVAQSGYGKGDQQVKPGDESVVGGDVVVELTVSETTCGRPDHAGSDNDADSKATGRPDHVGPPDHAANNGNRGNGSNQGNRGNSGKSNRP